MQAQLLLKWALHHGYPILPKSSSTARVEATFAMLILLTYLLCLMTPFDQHVLRWFLNAFWIVDDDGCGVYR